ncbi:MAG TPA: ROK family transcriptional regulator [Cyclobacteriaceae bacterium]|nr:ROK family transcriptional regulator [Cyclobacteriaceae bacterium]
MDLVKPEIVLEKMESVVEIKNYLNKIKIIKFLYTEGSNTANNIGQIVGISLPTVSLLLGDLLEEKLVVKQGRGESQGGRKPDLYGLAEDSFYILALDLDRFSTRVTIYNTKNEKVTTVHHLKVALNNEAATIDKIHQFANKVITESNIPEEKIIAIGITMPGLVESMAGINHTYLKVGKTTLKEQLEEKFGKKVYIENDARAMTLAEYKFGTGENQKNVLGIFVDWGIGLGIIIDKKLYRGFSGLAGEFSHSPLFDSKGINCSCGKRGCLETVASGTALLRLAKEAIAINSETILARMAREIGEELEPSWVIEAALAGDQQAISILSEVGLDLGRGIAILIQLFNPELIILGGSISEAKSYILTPIQQALNIYSMAKLSEKTEIKLSSLGKEVGLTGAVAIVNEHIFEETINQNNG